jgi:hypothetical protein
MSGRSGQGLDLVEVLHGDEQDKLRLRMILATITGELTIEQACRQLRIKRTRFYEMRGGVLQTALDALKPRGPGRPRAPRENREMVELQRKLVERDRDLLLARVREELLLTMPAVLARSL